jgi:hypothetical protein
MYDLWQPIQLIKETSNTCLEKEILNIFKKHYMIDAQFFQQITKYKLLSSIQGSLRWQKTITKFVNYGKKI